MLLGMRGVQRLLMRGLLLKESCVLSSCSQTKTFCWRAVLADPVKAPLGTDAPCLPITSSPVLLTRPALPRQLADAKACQNRKEALMLLDCRCFM